MNILENILYQEEIMNIKRNNEIYHLVLNEFLNNSQKNSPFLKIQMLEIK